MSRASLRAWTWALTSAWRGAMSSISEFTLGVSSDLRCLHQNTEGSTHHQPTSAAQQKCVTQITACGKVERTVHSMRRPTTLSSSALLFSFLLSTCPVERSYLTGTELEVSYWLAGNWNQDLI